MGDWYEATDRTALDGTWSHSGTRPRATRWPPTSGRSPRTYACLRCIGNSPVRCRGGGAVPAEHGDPSGGHRTRVRRRSSCSTARGWRLPRLRRGPQPAAHRTWARRALPAVASRGNPQSSWQYRETRHSLGKARRGQRRYTAYCDRAAPTCQRFRVSSCCAVPTLAVTDLDPDPSRSRLPVDGDHHQRTTRRLGGSDAGRPRTWGQ